MPFLTVLYLFIIWLKFSAFCFDRVAMRHTGMPNQPQQLQQLTVTGKSLQLPLCPRALLLTAYICCPQWNFSCLILFGTVADVLTSGIFPVM